MNEQVITPDIQTPPDSPPDLKEVDSCETMLEKITLLCPELFNSKDGKGVAKLFADTIHANFRFNVDYCSWMYYDGARWAVDRSDARIKRVAKEFASEIQAYEPKFGEFQCDEIKDLGKLSARQNMIRDAQDVHTVECSDFDKDIFKLNVLNCTIDLRAKKTCPHNPEDLITKIANVEYNRKADTSLIDKFMNEIFEGDQDLIDYVYRAFSLSLTGFTAENCLFLLLGISSRNGKTTLVKTIAYLLGDFSTNMAIETLGKRRYSNGSYASPDLARLEGKRMIVCEEPGIDFLMDDSKIKTLTGSDKITARMLRQNPVEFSPEGKIYICSNHRLEVQDDAIIKSRRIRIIPFNHHFGPDEQDLHLSEKLRTPEALSGLLLRLMRGFMDYENQGLNEPDAVLNAMASYETVESLIQAFFNDKLVISSVSDFIPLAVLYPQYTAWCSQNGYVPVSRTEIKTFIETHGMFRKMGTVNGITKRNLLVGYRFAGDAGTPPTNVPVTNIPEAESETNVENSALVLGNEM